MPNSAFNVETNLIDRNDLNIYEKMCSVVLARYAGRAEFSNMLNINVIAIRMGCDVVNAEKALNSLIQKKLVTLEDAGTIEPELLALEPQKVNSRVIKSESRNEASLSSTKALEPLAFESLENFDEETEKTESKESGADKPEKSEVVKPKRTRKAAPPKEKRVSKKSGRDESEILEEVAEKTALSPAQSSPRPLVPKQVREGVQDLIDQVFEIIDENINDREARIILSFAKNDIEQIKEKYKIAKNSQVNDKIEMLINELQKREGSVQSNGQGTKSPQRANDTPEETVKSLKNKQIDLDNINRMVALKQNSYGKQSQKK